MELKIEFEPRVPGSLIDALMLELPGGADQALRWKSETSISKGGQAAQLCFGLELGEDRRTPAWDELSRARVLAASWRMGGQASPGTIGRVSVWMVDRTRNVQAPLDMYGRTFPCPIPWEKLDRGARPMVRYFNVNGLATRGSSAGHPGTPDKPFWIDFRSDVDDGLIKRFMEKHAKPGEGFAARGMFCQRLRLDRDGRLSKAMRYAAADALDAALDLTDWAADTMSGRPGHGSETVSCETRLGTASRIVIENLDPGTADALYRAVWKDRVKEDILGWLEDRGEALSPEQIDYAADRYVYGGRYDCSLSYWQNIEAVVELARENA